MINQESRRIYGQLVRQFISGRMTNEEYEQKYEEIDLKGEDMAVAEIYQQVWLLYDDIETHRMTDKHRLNDAGRRQIAQIVLFLNSDKEYQWPKSSIVGSITFLLLIVCGIVTYILSSFFQDSRLLILKIAAWISTSLIVFIVAAGWHKNKSFQRVGNTDAWPFLSQEDLDDARKCPKLLAGRK